MLDQGRDTTVCTHHTDTVAGRYRLGPVLGRTPGSCAHRAYDELLQRTVRLTLVEPDPTTSDSGAFTLRPQGWQDRDPELAELYDAGSDGDRRFLVTHHPEEPTLAETTPPGGLDLAQLRDLGTSIATTLLPRHQRGAAHGGLGAGTVAFTPNGTSLAEFGLLPWLARWGDVPVAPPFPAPEQRNGTPTGPASDVYALGRLLDELAPEDGLRPDLQALISDMTAELPSARPSLEEVLRRLAERGARRAPAAGRALGRTGRRVGLVAAACALVGLGAGLSAFAGAGPSGGGIGATLSAEAAVPAPVLAPAPPPASSLVGRSSGTADTVSDDSSSSSSSSGSGSSGSSSSDSGSSGSGSSGSSGSDDGAVTPVASTRSAHVETAADVSRSTTHERSSGSDTDSADSQSSDAPTATTRTPDRSSDSTSRTSHDATGGSTHGSASSGHGLVPVLDRVGSSLGHAASKASGNATSKAPATHGSGTTKDAPQKTTSPTLPDPDLLDTTSDS